MTVLGIIPARYHSTRLPGKPLKDIHGKSMIRRVYEQTIKSNVDELIVATEDLRVYKEVLSFGGNAMLTSNRHISGTDRCFEVVKMHQKSFDLIVNIQGDEPFIEPQQINQLIKSFKDETTNIVTLAKRLESKEALINPSIPKVSFNELGMALSFDRIIKTAFDSQLFFKHIGLYAFRKNILKKICALPPSSLEIKYNLEQWRWLQNGFKIKVLETPFTNYSVDTVEDLKKVIERFGSTD